MTLGERPQQRGGGGGQMVVAMGGGGCLGKRVEKVDRLT